MIQGSRLSLPLMGRAGQGIVQQFPQFLAIQNKMFNERTVGMDIKHALDVMKGGGGGGGASHPLLEDESRKIALLHDCYKKCQDTYMNAYMKGYDGTFKAPANGEDELASKLRRDVDGWTLKAASITVRHVVDLLAGICAAWIIMKGKELLKFASASGLTGVEKTKTLMMPHTVQIIALFRLLKMSSSELDDVHAFWQRLVSPRFVEVDMMEGHMTQVGTGEGKSVILAILSCFLALTGVRVRCACYSVQLSSRDYKQFQDLFVKFKVDQSITYSNIQSMVEDCINDVGPVRKLVKDQLLNPKPGGIKRPCPAASKQKQILLIVEVRDFGLLLCSCYVYILYLPQVDVFFSDKFIGQTYNPIALHSCDDTHAVMKHIYAEIHDNKHDMLSVLSTTKKLPEYKRLVSSTFSKAAADVADIAIRNMISDARKFSDPEYAVFRNPDGAMVIGYKVMDAMSTTLHYGISAAYWL